MKTLEQLRSEIDSIDEKIVELFSQRMNCVKDVAKTKAQSGLAVENGNREREVVRRALELTSTDLHTQVALLFSTLFDISKSYQISLMNRPSKVAEEIEVALQKKLTKFPITAQVACQGVEGAFSEMAADKLFSACKITHFRNFEGVFQAVEKGLCQYGILPIENSSVGSVNEVYDLMKKFKFFIVKSIKVRVNHCLLAKKGAVASKVTEIFSHQQALNQCSEFLKKFPLAKITVCENTAMAAEKVAASDSPFVAAIASKNCSEIFGLDILSKDIQNTSNNYTRFICISKDLEIYSDANKISIMAALPHTAGSLYKTLSKFCGLGFNLTKLESRPVVGGDFEFLFYFDFNAVTADENVKKLLTDLEMTLEKFVFLGSYSEVV